MWPELPCMRHQLSSGTWWHWLAPSRSHTVLQGSVVPGKPGQTGLLCTAQYRPGLQRDVLTRGYQPRFCHLRCRRSKQGPRLLAARLPFSTTATTTATVSPPRQPPPLTTLRSHVAPLISTPAAQPATGTSPSQLPHGSSQPQPPPATAGTSHTPYRLTGVPHTGLHEGSSNTCDKRLHSNVS